MVADLMRWRKAGGPVCRLPPWDFDGQGQLWTDLANSAVGREACGWAAAAVPDQVRMEQALAALADVGLRGELETWLAAQSDEIRTSWSGTDVVRRHAPLLLAAAAAKGWAADLLDDLFLAADAVPLKGKA